MVAAERSSTGPNAAKAAFAHTYDFPLRLASSYLTLGCLLLYRALCGRTGYFCARLVASARRWISYCDWLNAEYGLVGVGAIALPVAHR